MDVTRVPSPRRRSIATLPLPTIRQNRANNDMPCPSYYSALVRCAVQLSTRIGSSNDTDTRVTGDCGASISATATPIHTEHSHAWYKHASKSITHASRLGTRGRGEQGAPCPCLCRGATRCLALLGRARTASHSRHGLIVHTERAESSWWHPRATSRRQKNRGIRPSRHACPAAPTARHTQRMES